MEWLQHPSTPICLIISRLLCPNSCVRNMGLCGCAGISVVTMAMAKELVPIIFACIVWGLHLSKHHVNFKCNNANLVIAINKGSSREKFVIHLLYSLWFFVAHFNIYVTVSHLPSVINITADHLSWGNMAQAVAVTPTLAPHPSLILLLIMRLISPPCWIGHHPVFFSYFNKRFHVYTNTHYIIVAIQFIHVPTY